MIRYISKTKPAQLRGTALLRLDFNTQDEWRMEAVLPTIKFLLRHADKVVIASHKGRPSGVERALSLRRNATDLAKLLRRPVIFIPHFRFPEMRRQIQAAPRGSVFLLENLRFNPGEAKDSRQFAKELASLADYYVDDAFAVAHRAAASDVAITKYLPACAGLELEREIKHLSQVLKRAKPPLVFVIGGAKAKDKLGILKYFRKRAKYFLLGGGSANTFLAIRGVDVGNSIRDTDPADMPVLKRLSREKNILTPIDSVISKNQIFDIGPKTAKKYAAILKTARTIIWAGPVGRIEEARYAKGSLAVARAIAGNRRAFSVTGGGETVMFLKKHKLDKKFSFISTGGGALLEYLEGNKLPGIEALEHQNRK